MPDPNKIIVDGIVSVRRGHVAHEPMIRLIELKDEADRCYGWRWRPEPLPDDQVDRWVRTGELTRWPSSPRPLTSGYRPTVHPRS